MNSRTPKQLVSLLILSVPLTFGCRLAFAQPMPMAAPAGGVTPSDTKEKAPVGAKKQPDLRAPSERDPALHVTVAQAAAQPMQKGHSPDATMASAPPAAATKDPHDGMASPGVAGGATTKYSDGRSLSVAPDGTTTTTFPGGRSISTMPDGCVVTRTPDGTSIARHADGSSTTTMPDGQMSKAPAPTAAKPGNKKTGMKGGMCCGKDPEMGGGMGPGMKGKKKPPMGDGMEGEMGGMGPAMGAKNHKHPKADQPTTESPPANPGMQGGDM